ncbi:MAG TPA: anthranilate synthase component I family protein [Gemmatimonadales bacterium]|nr:anthranilate synthase component I family protein [Gemmatimonadales bacterium]
MTSDALARCREAIAAGHGRVPLVQSVVLDGDTAVTAFAKLHRGDHGFLLESLEGGERWARFTFLATEPAAVYRYRGRTVEQLQGGAWTPAATDVSPLDHLGALLRETTAPELADLPRFTGGAVGFWGYDVVRSCESLPSPPPDDADLPDAVAMVVDTLLVLDHLFHRAIVIANVVVEPGLDDAALEQRISTAQATAESWLARLRAPSTITPLPVGPAAATARAVATSRYDGDAYRRDVAACQEHIAAGDAFQIVLSRRLDVAERPDPFLSYRWLRALNPAPYCYYLQLADLTLVGASPEVLVRVEREEVTVRPIAGTRPRGATPAEDAALEAELRADPKERAEHMMLVDLGRNDVGRVSQWGTVQVVAHMVVERYSQVMHLVSEVRGTLRPELDALDALAAAFPAGTVSGAPKVRAMEIIDTLEPSRRGPYAGAVGYVGYGARTMDTAIAIRTAVFTPTGVSVQAGAGIVADSVPEMELRETEAKAGAVLRALALADEKGEARSEKREG